MTRSRTGTIRLSRRRFIAIAAAASGASVLPRLAFAGQQQTITWHGIALGAEASLILQHHDEGEARSAIAECLAEVARLEAIFSLFRSDSALVRLNATGNLDNAPLDLRLLLAEALLLAERSDGAFDPTIQPLWALYARHFGSRGAAPEGPKERDIELALHLVDWRNVAIEAGGIRFRKPGTALTLNGIAQGYITDKVGDLLKRRGFTHVLVNMGEQLALGPKWDGAAWRVGIADPSAPDRTLCDMPLTGGAIATSGGYGCRFDAEGRFTHILDPRTGVSADRWSSVTVVADRATVADGLSTALSVAPYSPPLVAGAAGVFAVRRGASTGQWLSDHGPTG
jgi:thiamine biosynthesis lipoprotein